MSVRIERVGMEDFKLETRDFQHNVFQSVEFNCLNSNKADDIHYLIFRHSGKTLGGIIMGEKDGALFSPFSAPYGGFVWRDSLSFISLNRACEALGEYADVNHRSVTITLPPDYCYSGSTGIIAQTVACLQNSGFCIEWADIDFYTDLDQFREKTADKGLITSAQSKTFVMSPIDVSEENIKMVHRLVDVHHRRLGYDVTMTANDFIDVAKVAELGLFGVFYNDALVAASINFRVARNVAQVITWADDLEYRGHGIMDYMAAEMIDWYARNCYHIKILDFGPSGRCGMSSPGLCHFKRNLGTMASLKFTLRKG